MPQQALSMRKIREVLRLRYDLGLRQQEIARSCSIGQSSGACHKQKTLNESVVLDDMRVGTKTAPRGAVLS